MDQRSGGGSATTRELRANILAESNIVSTDIAFAQPEGAFYWWVDISQSRLPDTGSSARASANGRTSDGSSRTDSMSYAVIHSLSADWAM